MTTALYGPASTLLPAATSKPLVSYTGKITPWQAKPVKAKFLATVTFEVQPFVDQGSVAAGMPALFDLDFAVGEQLDMVGMWIGQSRFVTTPVPNIYFALDRAKVGLDQGYLQGPFDSPQGLSTLPDDLYRRLLYAKVVANRWDGTADMAEGILATFLTDQRTIAFVDDGGLAISPALYLTLDDPIRGLDVALWYNTPVSLDTEGHGLDEGSFYDPLSYPDVIPEPGIEYLVAISGKIPPATDLYILSDGLIPVKAMGAEVSYTVTTVDNAPLFGLDMETSEISGLDQGALGSDPLTVAQLIYGG